MNVHRLDSRPNWDEIKILISTSKEKIIGGIALEALKNTVEILEIRWAEIETRKNKSLSALHLRPSDVPAWGLQHAIEIEGTNVFVISKAVLYNESESKTIKFAAFLNKFIAVIRSTIRYENTEKLSAEWISKAALRESGLHYTLYNKPELVACYHSCEYNAKLKESPNAVRKMAITLEYCNERDLFKVNPHLLQNIDNILNLLRNMCEILDRLSKEQLLHRDIRPENLFIINKEGKLTMKLGDLGFAGTVNDERRRLQNEDFIFGGTIDYFAPEILFAKSEISDGVIKDKNLFINSLCSLKSDVWSMGIVLYERIIGNLPSFAGNIQLEKEEEKNIDSQKEVDTALYEALIPENCLEALQKHDQIRNFIFEMIRQMLVIDLEKRISGPDLLKRFHHFTGHI
jgi:serine/threonine protein kinase